MEKEDVDEESRRKKTNGHLRETWVEAIKRALMVGSTAMLRFRSTACFWFLAST
jgi:hypothetical protein